MSICTQRAVSGALSLMLRLRQTIVAGRWQTIDFTVGLCGPLCLHPVCIARGPLPHPSRRKGGGRVKIRGDQRDAVDQCSCHPTLLIPGLVSDLSDLSHMTITLAHDSISTSLPPRCHAITPSKLVAWDGSRSRSRTGEIREGVWTLLRNHIMVVRRPQHEAVYPYACLIYGWCGGGSGTAVLEPAVRSRWPSDGEFESSPAVVAVAVQLPNSLPDSALSNISFRRCGAWLDRAAAVAADNSWSWSTVRV